MRRGYLGNAVRAISRKRIRSRGWTVRTSSGCESSSPVSSRTSASISLDDPARPPPPPVDEEPAGALGHVAAHQQDADSEQRADPEGEAPADVGGEQRGVEQDDRGERAAGGPDPVAAVDDQVDAPAHAGGDQLVDRRVDRRVLAADAGAGEESCRVEVPGGEGEGGRHGGGDVDAERDQEELLAPEAVGELAEEERAEAGAADVEGGGGADLAGVEGDAAAVFGEAIADRCRRSSPRGRRGSRRFRGRSPPSSGSATRAGGRDGTVSVSRSSRLATRYRSCTGFTLASEAKTAQKIDAMEVLSSSSQGVGKAAQRRKEQRCPLAE